MGHAQVQHRNTQKLPPSNFYRQERGGCLFSHVFPSPVLQTYICSFAVFKKVLLIVSSMWLLSRSHSSYSAVLPALHRLIPCKKVHLLSWFICLILMA